MELAAKEPGVILDLYDFDQAVIWIFPREKKTSLAKCFFVFGIEFIPMAVTFRDSLITIGFISKRILLEAAGIAS